MNKPEWLSEFPFLDSQWSAISEITAKYSNIEFYQLTEDWDRFVSTYEVTNATKNWYFLFRSFRKSRLAYLAFHDLYSPLESHGQTMRLVSDLADMLIKKAYQTVEQEMIDRYGEVIDEHNKPVSLMVYSLGKLGTRELNYSSDVDLVFLFTSEGASNGIKTLDASSYFIRFGQKLIKLLGHYTNDGVVYRVDMRLRPFGSAGPLVCSIAAFHQYLLIEGREWERFAWMRSRLICGVLADEEMVKPSITPFIYRKHLDYTVFNALAKIKNEIAQHLSYGSGDLKQGAGGIRAVEFIVQSMQLVFGGRNESLQGTSIQRQLVRLHQSGQLQSNDFNVLMTAWLWLRKIENISQAVADQATHEIPESKEIRRVMAEAWGKKNWHELSADLTAQRNQVEKLFKQLFEQADDNHHLNHEHRKLLAKSMAEMPTSRMPTDRKEQVERLIQKSISLVTEPVLTEFVHLVKSIITRPSYIFMLQKESNVHRSVLELLAKHRYFSKTLQQYPVLLEQLFEHQKLKKLDQQELLLTWNGLNLQDDVESWMEGIRYFKLVQQFNLIVAWSHDLIKAHHVKQQLTNLAQFILAQVVKFSWREITRKIPGSKLRDDDLMVVAYGSAAVEEMTVSSDLDLVFVLDVDSLGHEERLFSLKWVKKIMHHLNSSMYHGKLYELDMQLRPNGHSGSLVTTRIEFERYQTSQAWVWEHAAMVKSRALVANPQQQKWHVEFRAMILQQLRAPIEVDKTLMAMADKLKRAHSKNQHEIEFKILAAVLKYSQQYPQLTHFIKLEQIVGELHKLGLWEDKDGFIFKVKKDPAS